VSRRARGRRSIAARGASPFECFHAEIHPPGIRAEWRYRSDDRSSTLNTRAWKKPPDATRADATRRRDERRDATTRDARDASAHAVRRRRRRTRTMLASATNERINERTNERTNE
jgi:hypothetical protein